MLNRFVDAFKSKDVRGRIFFTLSILLIYVLGLLIAVPGVEANVGEALANNDLLGIMNMLSGGALDSFSIFALGVSPYITASIIVQLLQMGVLPKLQELAEQGEAGQRKINDITRYLGLLLGAVQAYGMIVTLDNNNAFDFSRVFPDAPEWVTYVYVISIMLAGTMFVMWLSDQITSKGIGNGVSMIIFAGIIKGIPSSYSQVWDILVGTKSSGAEMFNGLLLFIAYVLYTCFIVLFVIFFELALRKIPIQQSRATFSQQTKMNYLPIKVNPGGVIPVIFAQAVLSAPVTILGFIDAQSSAYEKIKNLFSLTHLENGWPVALLIYIALIILFSFMYAHIQIDCDKISENLTKQGSYIPGIRTGNETRTYLSKVLNRVTFTGAVALAIVAALPYVIPMIFPTLANTAFGGTSLIIVVGVALETCSQMDGYVSERNYKSFDFNF
ncbi:MAG: preprotein translocase subunit SecY [Candidatus Caccosoma sp.]|nr:preprotein translocase subunit SecY [Candidatus Caccosoma sp.]